MTLSQIRKQILIFHSFTRGMRHKKFYIAQGAEETNLNGYSVDELRKIWFRDLTWPNNVSFKEDFAT